MLIRSQQLLRTFYLSAVYLSAAYMSAGSLLLTSTVLGQDASLPLSGGESHRSRFEQFEVHPERAPLSFEEGTSRTTLRMALAAPQSVTVPPPPATGPVQVPDRDASPSDAQGSNGQDQAEQSESAKQATKPTESSNGNNQSTTRTPAGRNDNALTPLQNRELSIRVQVVDLSVGDLGTGVVPESAADKRGQQTAYGRLAAYKCVHWQPSNICHFPLRYEETMLERHGHVRFGCWQPLVSGVRFFATIPLLPYLNTLRPAHEPVYALGNYRPGTCAPLLRDSLPYDKHAAVVETMAAASFFWAMPL